MQTKLCIMALLVSLIGVGCDKSVEVKDGFTFNLGDEDTSITVRFLAGGYQSTAKSPCNGVWPIGLALPYIVAGTGGSPDWFVASDDECGNVAAENNATGRIVGKAAAGVMLVDSNTISLVDLDVIYNGTATVDAVDEATGQIMQFTVGGLVFLAE
ncbi:MAG: hypothetical protein HQ523_04665 [Lentisphaerae bacterium]|nr:hypothetical protein [Lentisphaerota bacterium]